LKEAAKDPISTSSMKLLNKLNVQINLALQESHLLHSQRAASV
jgi:hypothetical protein